MLKFKFVFYLKNVHYIGNHLNSGACSIWNQRRTLVPTIRPLFVSTSPQLYWVQISIWQENPVEDHFQNTKLTKFFYIFRPKRWNALNSVRRNTFGSVVPSKRSWIWPKRQASPSCASSSIYQKTFRQRPSNCSRPIDVLSLTTRSISVIRNTPQCPFTNAVKRLRWKWVDRNCFASVLCVGFSGPNWRRIGPSGWAPATMHCWPLCRRTDRLRLRMTMRVSS